MTARAQRPARRRKREMRAEPAAVADEPRGRPQRPVAVLSEEQVELVHRKSLEMLRDDGIEMLHPPIYDMLEAHGCRVDRETGMVRFDPEAVMELVAKAPGTFRMACRGGAVQEYGTGKVWFGQTMGTFVTDLDQGHRPGSPAEMRDLMRLGQMTDTIDFTGGTPCDLPETPPELRDLEYMEIVLNETDKPYRVYGIGAEQTRDILELTAIAHDTTIERLHELPRCYLTLTFNTPRRLHEPLIEGLVGMARAGQVITCAPVVFSGAMGPMTLSGSMVLGNAEWLAGCALTQMIRPGTPIFYGVVTAPVSMKTGAPAWGNPETMIAMIAASQMARRYGAPRRTMVGCSSCAMDAQATYESVFSLMAAFNSGCDAIHSAHGMLESAMLVSREKIIVDSETIRFLRRTSRDVDFSDLDEAIESIRDVGVGGHFLGTAHTLARYKTEFIQPRLSDWQNYDSWMASGGLDANQRANRIWKELLQSYEIPRAAADRAEAVSDYVARRKSEIAAGA